MKKAAFPVIWHLAFCLCVAAIAGGTLSLRAHASPRQRPAGQQALTPFLRAHPSSDIAADGGGIEIPFRYDPPFMPFIVVQVRINGSAPLPFVVDTGVSAPLIVDSEAARRLHLRPNNLRGILNGSVDLVGASLSSVHLMGVHADEGQDCVPTRAFLLDMHLLDGSYTGPRIAGLVGAPLLTQFVVRFDFVRKVMTLFPAAAAPRYAPGATAIPLYGRDEGYYINVSPQEGIRVRVEVDTGALASTVPVTTAPYLHSGATTFSYYRQLGISVIGDRWQLRDYRIGDYREKDVAVNGAPDFTSSVLGLDVLQRFRVTLDFMRGKLILERASDYADRARLPGGTGIELGPDGRGLRVRSVEAGSKAAAAGVVSGSEILSADGYALGGLPYAVAARLVSGSAGTTATLRLRRAGRVEVISFVRDTEFDGPHGAGTGLTLEKREGGPLLVLRVGAGSVPEVAGLAAADEVVALNGTAVANLTDEEAWERLHGRTVTLTARRKGVLRPITVTLTDARLQARNGSALR